MLVRLVSFVIVGTLVACGGGSSTTSSTSSSSPTSPTDASCGEVCASIAKKCGAAPPTCAQDCPKLSVEVRTCIVEAPVCDFDRCGGADNASNATSDGDDDASGDVSSTDPCAGCRDDQICVEASSVTSDVGCFDRPSTCNGSTTSICPCLLPAGNGPCSKGGKACTETGASIRLSCQ